MGPNTQFCVKITQLKNSIFKYLLIPIVRTTSKNKKKIQVNHKMASQKRSKTKISFADTTKNTESFETKTSDISLHSNFSNKSGNSQKDVTLQNIDRTKINKQQIRKLPNLGQQGPNFSKRNKKKSKNGENDDPDNQSTLNSDEEQEIFRQKLEKLQLFQEANAKPTKTTKNVQKNLLEKTKILGKLGSDPAKNLTPKALRQILENLANRKSMTRIGHRATSAKMVSQNRYSTGSRRVSNKTSNLSNFEGHDKDQTNFTNEKEKELTSTIARNLLSDLK